MTKEELLQYVTTSYLKSRDFNGLAPDSSVPTEAIETLIQEGLVSLNRGDRHPNPHIKAFEPEPPAEQLEKLRNHGVTGCLYPEPKHLEKVVDRSRYSDRPFTLCLALGAPQLSFKVFDLSILEHYRNDPRYYFDVDDVHGSMSVHDDYFEKPGMAERDQTFLQTFGFAHDSDLNRAVAVYVRYLDDLTPEHQRIWETRMLSGDFAIHPDYHTSSMGHFPEKVPIFIAFGEELHQINNMCRLMDRAPFFHREFRERDRPRDFAFLLRPTLKSFNDFVHLLDKMISDNINTAFFGDEVSLEREETRADGKIVVHRKGSLQVLGEWLDNEFRAKDTKPIEEMLATFRKIRKMRQRPAHAVDKDVFDQKYFKEQRHLVIDAYKAVRMIRLIFANHPAAKQQSIPDWLLKGQIRDY